MRGVPKVHSNRRLCVCFDLCMKSSCDANAVPPPHLSIRCTDCPGWSHFLPSIPKPSGQVPRQKDADGHPPAHVSHTPTSLSQARAVKAVKLLGARLPLVGMIRCETLTRHVPKEGGTPGMTEGRAQAWSIQYSNKKKIRATGEASQLETDYPTPPSILKVIMHAGAGAATWSVLYKPPPKPINLL